ncbi:hypothetical protein TRFO_08280 [Tritrichomonas foetus]|uniref:Maspardin n=1 Tax=Tritrichomonas foetus TaxID=1144522 RepID=A0A1J4JLU0_9EUKA|nr:hypothetical protein TRFO_08280 [Tritrichomonas foetus]|eukprot:OHS99657.1 hypothetical protein TRFO_08280 [Tritrichomonas foetus]
MTIKIHSKNSESIINELHKIMEKFNPQPQLHVQDPLFMSISVSHPLESEIDYVYGNQIQYRRFGSTDETQDAVIMIPGLYESCSGSVYLFALLEKYGYRGYIIELPGYKKFKHSSLGFIQFCAKKKIQRCHLIGSDLGGYQCLQIASYPYVNKEIEILSIILINSYTDIEAVKNQTVSSKIFGKLAAKRVITKDIERANNINPNSKSTNFITKEIKFLNSEDIATRLELMNSHPRTIELCVPNEAVMSIETLNHTIPIPESAIPSVSLENCRVALLKDGGDWPHIEEPEDACQYILAHLRKFGNIPKLDQILKNTNENQEEEPNISEKK